MQENTVQQTPVSELLADPAQVAAVRELIVHARAVRAQHHTYSFGNGLGQPMGPVEHTWTVGTSRVLIHDGWLVYLSHGAPLLKVTVDHPRQVGQLLAAIGVLPQRFAGLDPAPSPVNPDRRCRTCNATSGLILLPGNPLTGAGRAWECVDGCPGGAR